MRAFVKCTRRGALGQLNGMPAVLVWMTAMSYAKLERA